MERKLKTKEHWNRWQHLRTWLWNTNQWEITKARENKSHLLTRGEDSKDTGAWKRPAQLFMQKMSTNKSQTWPAASSSAIVAPARKARRPLVAGVRFLRHRMGGWENARGTMCRVTLASTKPSVASSVTTTQGWEEDTCRGASQVWKDRLLKGI